MLILAFKYFNNNYSATVLERNQHNRNTRNSNLLLKIPVPRCSSFAQSAHFKLPSKWNSLANSNNRVLITSSRTTNAFKRSLKINLIENQV